MIARWIGVIIKTNANFAATNRRFAAVKRLAGFHCNVLRAGIATVVTWTAAKAYVEWFEPGQLRKIQAGSLALERR